MSVYFISDTHWGHTRIIELSYRPFSSVDEMDEALIANWNAVVAPNHTVYHLGDFAHRAHPGDAARIFARLNGIKHLIRGNHDDDEVLSLPWDSVSDYKEIKLNKKKIVLSHYPMRSWNGMYRGSLHFYGHEHGAIQDYSNCVDVGVDNGWNYTPVTLDQCMERMSTLTPWVAKAPKE